jgi:hypothetical protein
MYVMPGFYCITCSAGIRSIRLSTQSEAFVHGIGDRSGFGVAPGQCATVSDNRPTDIWFYIYVASNGGPIGGDSRLCVRQQAFKSGQQFLHQG